MDEDLEKVLTLIRQEFDNRLLTHRHTWQTLEVYEETSGLLGLARKKVTIQSCYICQEVRKV